MTEHPAVPPPDGYPPPPGQARREWLDAHQLIGTLPKEAYTSWIRRVGAAIVDQGAFLLFAFGCGLIVGEIDVTIGAPSCPTSAASCSPPVVARIVDASLYLLPLVFWVWNWGYRQGATGSTIGKLALRFKTVDERNGQPIGFKSSIVRQFAHFLDSVTIGIGYLLPLFTAKRQTLADMAMSTVCLPIEPRR
jgi:uncharacterized RDD family membrane protein YckC